MNFAIVVMICGIMLGCGTREQDPPPPRQVDNPVTRYGERLRGAVDDAEQVAERVNRRQAERMAEMEGAE